MVRGRDKYGGYEFESRCKLYFLSFRSKWHPRHWSFLFGLIHLLMNAEVSGSILGFSFHNFLIGLMAFVSICLFFYVSNEEKKKKVRPGIL